MSKTMAKTTEPVRTRGGLVFEEAPETYYFYAEIDQARAFRLPVARNSMGEELALDVDLAAGRAVFARLSGPDVEPIVLQSFDTSDIPPGGRVIAVLSLSEDQFTATLNGAKFILKPGGEAGMSYRSSLGEFGAADDAFLDPRAIALDSRGNIYVADAGDHRVRKFDETGKLLRVLGGPGSGPGEFVSPGGLALDENDALYVADTGNRRIQKFEANGDFVFARGEGRSGRGRLFSADARASAPDGMILVLDARDASLHRFSSRGDFISRSSIRLPEEHPGFRPTTLALDVQGNMLMGTADGGPILIFAGDGEYRGVLTRESRHARALTIDDNSRVHVACGRTRKIHTYDWRGEALRESEPYREIIALRSLPGGGLAALDAGAHRVYVFSSEGELDFIAGGYGEEPGRFRDPRDITPRRDGGFYVADNGNRRIQEFDARGGYKNHLPIHDRVRELNGIMRVGEDDLLLLDGESNSLCLHKDSGESDAHPYRRGPAPGHPMEPTALAADGAGNLFVLDQMTGLVHKFDERGVISIVFGTGGNGRRLLKLPRALALDEAGDLYSADGDEVLRFDASGAHRETLAASGSVKALIAAQSRVFVLDQERVHDNIGRGGGDFAFAAESEAIAMARGPAGNFHVLTRDGVVVHDATGKRINAFGRRGSGHGRFLEPNDVVDLDENRIAVADGGENPARIHIFARNGKFLESRELAPGSHPAAMVRDENGSLFIADTENNLIREIDSSGIERANWDGTRDGAPPLNAPTSLARLVSGNLLVCERNAHRLRVFSPDGRTLKTLGGKGDAPGLFFHPTAVAARGDDVFLVLDAGNHRVQLLRGDDEALVLETDMAEPSGALFDREGGIHVSDSRTDQIHVFHADGTPADVWGGHGRAPGRFRDPARIRFAGGDYYVLDAGNFRVQIFRASAEDTEVHGRPGLEGGENESRPSWAVMTARDSLTASPSLPRKKQLRNKYHLLSLSAREGEPGAEISARGAGFSSSSRALLGDFVLTTTFHEPDELRIRIGSEVRSGPLIIRDAFDAGNHTEPVSFRVLRAPKIQAVRPLHPEAGGPLDILGAGFAAPGAKPRVWWNETELALVSHDDHRLRVLLPVESVDATSGEIRVETAGAVASFSPVLPTKTMGLDLIAEAEEARVHVGPRGTADAPLFGEAFAAHSGAFRLEKNRSLRGDEVVVSRMLRMSPPEYHGAYIRAVYPRISFNFGDELELEFGYLDQGDSPDEEGAVFSADFRPDGDEPVRVLMEPRMVGPQDGPRRVQIVLPAELFGEGRESVAGELGLRVMAGEATVHMIPCWSRIRLNTITI